LNSQELSFGFAYFAFDFTTRRALVVLIVAGGTDKVGTAWTITGASRHLAVVETFFRLVGFEVKPGFGGLAGEEVLTTVFVARRWFDFDLAAGRIQARVACIRRALGTADVVPW
jgi:hypothetical protein